MLTSAELLPKRLETALEPQPLEPGPLAITRHNTERVIRDAVMRSGRQPPLVNRRRGPDRILELWSDLTKHTADFLCRLFAEAPELSPKP
jgi:hypothetical protein